MRGGGELLPVHQETAVAGERHHRAFRMHDFCCDGGGHAVAHGAAGRPELRAESGVAIEAVYPDGKIAGAVGDDGFRRQALAEEVHDLAHVDLARHLDRLLPGFKVGARFFGPGIPCRFHRGEFFRGRREFRHAAVDQQITLIHAAEFFGAGVYMHQFLRRARNVDQRVVGGGPFAESRADDEQQVGAFDAFGEFGIQADGDITDVVRVAVVDQVLAAEGGAHRQIEGAGKGEHVVAGLFVPAAAAEHHERAFGFAQQVAQFVHVEFAGIGGDALIAADVGRRRKIGLHVLRQRQHHRAGAARRCQMKGVADVFGDAVGAVDLRHPLGHRAVHAAKINFLESFALDDIVADLADEQDHRR